MNFSISAEHGHLMFFVLQTAECSFTSFQCLTRHFDWKTMAPSFGGWGMSSFRYQSLYYVYGEVLYVLSIYSLFYHVYFKIIHSILS